MPYSAHRSRQFDSQGQILLDSDSTGDADDLEFIREFEPTGSELPTQPVPSFDTPSSDESDAPGSVPAPAPAAEKPARQTRVKRPRKARAPGSRLRTLAILGGADGEVLDGVPME